MPRDGTVFWTLVALAVWLVPLAAFLVERRVFARLLRPLVAGFRRQPPVVRILLLVFAVGFLFRGGAKPGRGGASASARAPARASAMSESPRSDAAEPSEFAVTDFAVSTTNRTVFFTHGFNVSAHEARAWGSEVFKRLWQAGSNAKFKMVTWAGDYNWTGNWANDVHYHEDVYRALRSGGALRRLVEREEPTAANRVLMAQSLGNMMACEALRQGLTAGRYFMFNAAVASEALEASLQNLDDATRAKYVPSDWNGYPALAWAANWHRWFADDIWRALAENVPAVSSPLGGRAAGIAGVENLDLNDGSYRNGWAGNRGVRDVNWLHSDMKDMAFFHVIPLYDELVLKGDLK